MPLTIYSDVIMPNSLISAGVRGKNIRMNERSQNQAGFDTVNIIWNKTLRQYELGTVPLSVDLWQTLEGLHEVTEGGAYGFLLEDPKDCSVVGGLLYPVVAGAVGGTIGFGYGVPTMKMYKRYTSAGSTRIKDRQITRPRAPSALTRGGMAVTLGAAAGNASVDADTGTVTFVADASQALSSVTVGASTVLNFANGTGMVAAMSVGERVYLTGITGTAATALNSLSHVISAKGATSLTVSTSTAGLTAAAGTAFKYPQASEALGWSGRFYVPVHFMEDSIDWDLVSAGQSDQRLMAGPSVVLIEVRE